MPEKPDVRKVAKIARLHLTEKEIDKFTKDLESMLDAFKDLDAVRTKGVRPSFQPIVTKNILRKDTIESSLTQEQALFNTRNKEKGQFKGPKAA